MSNKIKHLVVDTTAFIKAAKLQNIAEYVYTIQEVVNEITCVKQRRELVVLPYDLEIKNVFPEDIQFITEFSKKTGDYTSLSATDIKVLALTYQLEKEKVGTEHLKSEPTMQKIVTVSGLSHKKTDSDNEISKLGEQQLENHTVIDSSDNKAELKLDQFDMETSKEVQKEVDGEESEEDDAEAMVEQLRDLDLNEDKVNELMTKISDEEESEEEESDSDDGEWITPENIAQKKREMDIGEFEDKSVEVACITSDFAMQNILKQIGLNVTTIDGRIIRQLRTYIFRCTTCFKTTSVMTKLFCPKCGHATLKKVGVSIDEQGNQHIHINGRKPLTARGKRFSLPTPKGGQHFQYPILTEDQHIHKRFARKIVRDPDYVAGFSPFAKKDTNSKSAVLGIRANSQDVRYWMKHYSKGKKK